MARNLFAVDKPIDNRASLITTVIVLPSMLVRLKPAHTNTNSIRPPALKGHKTLAIRCRLSRCCRPERCYERDAGYILRATQSVDELDQLAVEIVEPFLRDAGEI
jgi:hypothetical protein